MELAQAHEGCAATLRRPQGIPGRRGCEILYEVIRIQNGRVACSRFFNFLSFRRKAETID
jgi:hypothetical protein